MYCLRIDMERSSTKNFFVLALLLILPCLFMTGSIIQVKAAQKDIMASNFSAKEANLAQAGNTGGLVNCGNPGADGELQENEMCDFQDLINLIQNLINWLIGILTIVATLLFMYAGFLYLTAGGDGGQVDTAKTIFQNVAGGFVIALLAFTLIATLVNLLTRDDWQDNWEEAIPIQLSLDDDLEPGNHSI
jgi:hypothetical protein